MYRTAVAGKVLALAIALVAGSARAESVAAKIDKVDDKVKTFLSVIPVLRVMAGPAIHFAPPEEKRVTAAVDVTAGAAINAVGSLRVGLFLVPELGYSYDGVGAHAFSFLGGIGVGNLAVFAAYHPRLVVGTAAGEGFVGMRNAIGVHAFLDSFCIEGGHQFVRHGGALHHDGRVMFGVNPAALIYFTVRLVQGLNALTR
jgi:hypothetical protein